MKTRILSFCSLPLILGIAVGLSGCGDGGTGMSAADEAAIKAHDASKMAPPPGANMAPGKDFKSSISDGPSQLGSGNPGVPGAAGGTTK